MSEPLGIIYPPPDLRGIVDRTATYVAKNGSAFEARIINEQKGKPKFSFLFANDPFNAYYKHKVNEIRNNLLNNNESNSNKQVETRSQSSEARTADLDTPSARPVDDGDSSDTKDDQDIRDSQARENNEQINVCDTNDIANNHQQSGTVDDDPDQTHIKPKLGDYIQEMTMKLEEPPALNYLASPAPTITHLECDIIKLTSQFIAIHGRSFLLELVSREQTNSLFDFLKPQHGQFPYMTNLVMQYALIQNPPLDILEHLERDATNQRHVFDSIRMRAEWVRMLETERKKREEAEEREKELYNQIDWHDFVIVETVDYQPGDKGEYPPTTADHVGTRLLKQQRLEDHNNPEEMEIDMDVESDQSNDDDGDDNREEKEQVADEFVVPQPPVNIRKDYDPKAAAKAAATTPDYYYVSPLTNERISADKMHEHVRYNLADPKQLEKKEQILQGKLNEEVVFASGSQIQQSLKNLAERRTDIFGMNDAEAAIGQRIGEDDDDQTNVKDDKIIWDGHKSSLKKKKLN